MYKKVGEIKSQSEDGPIILKNPEGKCYEVNALLAFVWDQLDGHTQSDDIIKQLDKISELSETESENLINQAIKALSETELIEAIR